MKRWTDTAKLAAIRARLDGDWDHPALLELGPLRADALEDIRRILASGHEPVSHHREEPNVANYYAQYRSNYFRVEDFEAFKAWCDALGMDAWQRSDDPTLVAFGSRDGESGVPSHRYNDATQDFEDIDFAAELSEHLLDNEIAIVQEAGHEKLRYVTGYALAINAAGEVLHISIDDIYALVQHEWGLTPTKATY